MGFNSEFKELSGVGFALYQNSQTHCIVAAFQVHQKTINEWRAVLYKQQDERRGNWHSGSNVCAK